MEEYTNLCCCLVEAKLSRARPHQAKSLQANPNQLKSYQAKPNQAKPSHAKSFWILPLHAINLPQEEQFWTYCPSASWLFTGSAIHISTFNERHYFWPNPCLLLDPAYSKPDSFGMLITIHYQPLQLSQAVNIHPMTSYCYSLVVFTPNLTKNPPLLLIHFLFAALSKFCTP